MTVMRVGCQTYTWEMLGERWSGTPDDMMDAVAAAGYAGIEFSNNTIGAYWDDPDALREALAKRSLSLAAFAYATTGFTDAARFAEDFAGAERAIDFAAKMGCVLCLGGPSSASRDDYDAKIAQAVRFYTDAADRAGWRGVPVALHPHSHHTSLMLSAEDYASVLEATEDSGLGYNPDTGHILRGGQDLLDCVRRYADRIVHVHLKDVDAEGKWRVLGEGLADLEGLLDFLREADYDGWLVAEEESDLVWESPTQAIEANRETLRRLGI